MKLDFNSVQKPTLELVMKDEAKTSISVSIPKVVTLEKLKSNLSNLTGMLKTENTESVQALFDLAAELISTNTEGKTVTGEELRTVYGLELEDLLAFYKAYLEFINEIKTAKN